MRSRGGAAAKEQAASSMKQQAARLESSPDVLGADRERRLLGELDA